MFKNTGNGENKYWEIDKVYHTSDYNLFKKDPINRLIAQNHVKKLTKSLQNHQVTDFIKVYQENDKLIIWDGQHRFEALKSLGRPIGFIVIEKPPVGALAEVNNATKRWGVGDYLNSFSNDENEDVRLNYRLLMDTKKLIEEGIAIYLTYRR